MARMRVVVEMDFAGDDTSAIEFWRWLVEHGLRAICRGLVRRTVVDTAGRVA